MATVMVITQKINMIFITGATGLLGTEITKSLIVKGESIKVLHRSNISELKSFGSKITLVEGDLSDTALLQKELEDIDTVIHCAALVSFDKKDRKKLDTYNVQGTKNLVDAATQSSVRKFIHISSVAALGRTKKQTIISESQKWLSSKFNSNYAVSKYLAELEVWRGFEEGLDGFILNPSVVLGKGNWNNSSSTLFKLIYKQRKYFPQGHLNYVDLKDLRDILVSLMESKINHERFIVNGGSVSYETFFKKVSLEFGFAGHRKVINKFWLKTVKTFCDINFLFSGKPRALTKETLRSLSNTSTYDNSKIKKLLTFEFRTLDKTLKDVIPFYIKVNNL